MKKETKPLKPRKGQKCWGCKKPIKLCDFCWNGHYWHPKCIEKEAIRRFKKYNLIKEKEV